MLFTGDYMKKLAVAAITAAAAAAVTKEDLVFLLSIIITVINAIIEYLRSKRDAKDKDETE
jgi:hypothetical protein